MENDLTRQKVIAVDFDGCLCVNAYPEIGPPLWDVIVAAAREREKGAALILWTCREGELLCAALDACKRWGLIFDAVNESLPEWREAYGNDPRKIGGTEYWDDKAVRMPAVAALPVVRCCLCQYGQGLAYTMDPPINVVRCTRYGQEHSRTGSARMGC